MWIQASSKKGVKHTVRVYSPGHLHMYFVLSVILNAGHFFLSLSRQVKKYAISMCLKILVRHIFDDLSFMSPCVVSWKTDFFLPISRMRMLVALTFIILVRPSLDRLLDFSWFLNIFCQMEIKETMLYAFHDT